MIRCRKTIVKKLLNGNQIVSFKKIIILIFVVTGRCVDTGVFFKVVCSPASDSVFLDGDRYVFLVLELVVIDG